MAAKDILMIAVLIFSMGVGFFIIHYAVNTTVDSMVDVTALNETEEFVDIMRGVSNMTNRMDYIIFGLFLGLIFGLIITGWFVGGNPLFMFIYFMIVTMAVIISTVFDYVWDSISGASVFGTTVTSFPITNNILSNLPLYMSAIGMLGLVVMFAKPYFQRQ